VLEEGEMIVAITFDAPQRAAYAKFRNPASRYAMTGVFVARRDNGDVRVAVTGAGADGVFRHAGMEAALAASWSPDALANIVVDPSELLSDIHANAEYRANLVKVMAKRAVAAS
jgi:carbon-monoxide dehydrogenase medium subunit